MSGFVAQEAAECALFFFGPIERIGGFRAEAGFDFEIGERGALGSRFLESFSDSRVRHGRRRRSSRALVPGRVKKACK
jgi:hypothetical protein